MKEKLYVTILTTLILSSCKPPIAYENFLIKNPKKACLMLKRNGISLYKPVIQEVYPHPLTNVLGSTFTEGFFYHEGKIYESGGPEGQGGLYSYLLGDLVARPIMANKDNIFPEGTATDGKKIVMLTEKSQFAFVIPWSDFSNYEKIAFKGLGWGLTYDGKNFIKSDGSSELTFLNKETLKQERTLQVTLAGNPVDKINELEFIHGYIYANIWYTSAILKIHPQNGRVVAVIEASNITDLEPRYLNKHAVLNGIAFNSDLNQILLTGKRWGSIYALSLLKQNCK